MFVFNPKHIFSYIGKNPYNLGRLNLATELLAMIFNEIDDFSDALCFAVAHPRLMAIGERRLRKLYEPYIAPPWAGDCFVVLGHSARICDLPQSAATTIPNKLRKQIGNGSIIKSMVFRAQLTTRTPPSEIEKEDVVAILKNRMMRKPVRKTRRRGGTNWTKKKVHKKDLEEKKRKKLEERENTSDWMRAEMFLARATFPLGKKDIWVLCNLSKRVYVRRNYLAKKNRTQEYRYGYECQGRLGLGSVLLRYTQCCAGARRSWAGDRFVVTTLAELEKQAEATNVEYTDVSAEVYQKVKKSLVRKRFGTGYDSEEESDDESDEVESGSEYSEDFYY